MSDTGNMRFSRPKRPDWPLTEAATKLAAEAEAWSNGSLADLRQAARHDGLAPWLVLNRAAHADLTTLRQADRQTRVVPGRGRHRHRLWTAAEHDVVHQVLATASSPDDLARLQRRVLVPLETDLIERSKVGKVTLTDVVAATTAALANSH